jgi:hypothetical protein
VCTADLSFTGGKNDIGAGTDTDFIGACTPATLQTTACWRDALDGVIGVFRVLFARNSDYYIFTDNLHQLYQ